MLRPKLIFVILRKLHDKPLTIAGSTPVYINTELIVLTVISRGSACRQNI
ncbi:hypothetical protein MIDIC_470028 [Alphaproteobacteria bacterium]